MTDDNQLFYTETGHQSRDPSFNYPERYADVIAVVEPKTKDYKLSVEGKAQIAGLEGIILSKYYDSVNVQTIGIGSTRSDIPNINSWSWDKVITIDEAIDMFIQLIQPYVNAVNTALKVPIEQHEFDALVSICYNIGKDGMARSTFMRRINAGAALTTIANAIMLWDIPSEIIGRRTKEAELYLYGVYSEEGMVGISPVSKSSHRPLYRDAKAYNILEELKRREPPPISGTTADKKGTGGSIVDKLKDLFWHY